MHHPDYARPYDIVWLCKKCHASIHRMFSDAENKALYKNRRKYGLLVLTNEQKQMSVNRLSGLLEIPRATLTRYLQLDGLA